jgi:DNA-binding HxlR family transcriptional regulator
MRRRNGARREAPRKAPIGAEKARMSRTYNQDCVLAYAFDLLGERWTFLIIRELFLGPRRFGDLHAALPGIGTNLLSKRLKELEEAGLVRSAGDGAAQYRLTEQGEALRPTARALMFWAIDYFMSRPEPSAPKECIFSNDLVPDSVALAIEMFADKCALPHANYVLHLTIDEAAYTYFFMNGEMTARRGQDAPAVARIETDVATLMQAMRGEIYLDETKKRAKLSGDASAIEHFISSFTPGADVAFEVAEMIKQRKLERRSVRESAAAS